MISGLLLEETMVAIPWNLQKTSSKEFHGQQLTFIPFVSQHWGQGGPHLTQGNKEQRFISRPPGAVHSATETMTETWAAKMQTCFTHAIFQPRLLLSCFGISQARPQSSKYEYTTSKSPQCGGNRPPGQVKSTLSCSRLKYMSQYGHGTFTALI